MAYPPKLGTVVRHAQMYYSVPQILAEVRMDMTRDAFSVNAGAIRYVSVLPRLQVAMGGQLAWRYSDAGKLSTTKLFSTSNHCVY